MDNVNTENKRTIFLPKDQIVCARQYPMTERTSGQLRAAREYFIDKIRKEKGEEVVLPFPTVLAFLIEDYSKLRGLKPDADSK